MAKLLIPVSNEDLKKMNVTQVRNEYTKLSDFYQKIVNNDLMYCPVCCKWKTSTGFYSSHSCADGYEHSACKECILDECTDLDKKTGIRTDNRDKSVNTFRRLDWYFDEPIYNEQKSKLAEQTGEKVRSTAIQQWIVMCRSLPQYDNLKFNQSILFNEEVTDQTVKKPRKEITKIFGQGLSTQDYLYLQDQYDDWCARTQVDTKSQQTYIVQICYKQLEIWKAQRVGKDTDKLIKSLNELMNGANLQPRQNVGNAATDALSFGQLIEKIEQERPISEPNDEFKDVDGIGKYIRVWFKGHLCKAFGIDNGYSQEYEDYVKQYTVTKPTYEEDGKSEAIYSTLFGKDSDL